MPPSFTRPSQKVRRAAARAANEAVQNLASISASNAPSAGVERTYEGYTLKGVFQPQDDVENPVEAQAITPTQALLNSYMAGLIKVQESAHAVDSQKALVAGVLERLYSAIREVEAFGGTDGLVERVLKNALDDARAKLEAVKLAEWELWTADKEVQKLKAIVLRQT